MSSSTTSMSTSSATTIQTKNSLSNSLNENFIREQNTAYGASKDTFGLPGRLFTVDTKGNQDKSVDPLAPLSMILGSASLGNKEDKKTEGETYENERKRFKAMIYRLMFEMQGKLSLIDRFFGASNDADDVVVPTDMKAFREEFLQRLLPTTETSEQALGPLKRLLGPKTSFFHMSLLPHLLTEDIPSKFLVPAMQTTTSVPALDGQPGAYAFGGVRVYCADGMFVSSAGAFCTGPIKISVKKEAVVEAGVAPVWLDPRGILTCGLVTHLVEEKKRRELGVTVNDEESKRTMLGEKDIDATHISAIPDKIRATAQFNLVMKTGLPSYSEHVRPVVDDPDSKESDFGECQPWFKEAFNQGSWTNFGKHDYEVKAQMQKLASIGIINPDAKPEDVHPDLLFNALTNSGPESKTFADTFAYGATSRTPSLAYPYFDDEGKKIGLMCSTFLPGWELYDRFVEVGHTGLGAADVQCAMSERGLPLKGMFTTVDTDQDKEGRVIVTREVRHFCLMTHVLFCQTEVITATLNVSVRVKKAGTKVRPAYQFWFCSYPDVKVTLRDHAKFPTLQAFSEQRATAMKAINASKPAPAAAAKTDYITCGFGPNGMNGIPGGMMPVLLAAVATLKRRCYQRYLYFDEDKRPQEDLVAKTLDEEERMAIVQAFAKQLREASPERTAQALVADAQSKRANNARAPRRDLDQGIVDLISVSYLAMECGLKGDALKRAKLAWTEEQGVKRKRDIDDTYDDDDEKKEPVVDEEPAAGVDDDEADELDEEDGDDADDTKLLAESDDEAVIKGGDDDGEAKLVPAAAKPEPKEAKERPKPEPESNEEPAQKRAKLDPAVTTAESKD